MTAERFEELMGNGDTDPVSGDSTCGKLEQFAGELSDLLNGAVNHLSLVEILGVMEVAKFEVQVAGRRGAMQEAG